MEINKVQNPFGSWKRLQIKIALQRWSDYGDGAPYVDQLISGELKFPVIKWLKAIVEQLVDVSFLMKWSNSEWYVSEQLGGRKRKL